MHAAIESDPLETEKLVLQDVREKTEGQVPRERNSGKVEQSKTPLWFPRWMNRYEQVTTAVLLSLLLSFCSPSELILSFHFLGLPIFRSESAIHFLYVGITVRNLLCYWMGLGSKTHLIVWVGGYKDPGI